MLFDLAVVAAAESVAAAAEGDAGVWGCGCRGCRRGGPSARRPRGPQRCGADYAIGSRLGSLTPESRRYASLAGSLWLNRLANPNRLLDHLHGIALGFRNLQNYIHRSLLHTGGLKHHPLPVL